MVLEDSVLAGYKERVERAVEEDPKWKVYLGKRQAQVEWEKLLEEQRDYLSGEEARRIMLSFFRGSDLRYCEGR